jgi:hypothetical protein
MKTKLTINNIFGKVLFGYECENNTIKKTVSEAVKCSANLRSVNLSSANLRSVNLSSADLRSVNLSSADLRSVNLSSANLSSAKTDKRYIQISCIGSRNAMTTYCFEDNTIWCGCFKGTLEEFEARTRDYHEYNESYLNEYLGFINYIKSLR